MRDRLEMGQTSDVLVVEARRGFVAEIAPHVKDLMEEEGSLTELLHDLTSEQLGVFCGIVTEFAAVLKVGRTDAEIPVVKDCNGRRRRVDPLKEIFSERLKRSGVSRQLCGVIPTVASSVLEAYLNNPVLSEPKGPFAQVL